MRDPRIDPREGDVVENESGKYWVTGRDGDVVYYRDTPPDYGELSIPLDQWQINAENDRILERGP